MGRRGASGESVAAHIQIVGPSTRLSIKMHEEKQNNGPRKLAEWLLPSELRRRARRRSEEKYIRRSKHVHATMIWILSPREARRRVEGRKKVGHVGGGSAHALLIDRNRRYVPESASGVGCWISI